MINKRENARGGQDERGEGEQRHWQEAVAERRDGLVNRHLGAIVVAHHVHYETLIAVLNKSSPLKE